VAKMARKASKKSQRTQRAPKLAATSVTVLRESMSPAQARAALRRALATLPDKKLRSIRGFHILLLA